MRLAPVPPRSSVLPPGAGNEEAKKAVETGKERAKKTEQRYVVETGAVQRNLDMPAMARHDDGDRPSVLPIQLAQAGLQTLLPRGGAVRCGQSSRVGMGVNVHPMVLDASGRGPTLPASDAPSVRRFW